MQLRRGQTQELALVDKLAKPLGELPLLVT
jgi:hypothetical protein